LGILLAVAAFPHLVLSLLGPKYHGLTAELLLFIASSGMALWSSCAYALSASRGIILRPVVSLPFLLILQAILIWLLPLNTVSGVLCLSIVMSFFQGLLPVIYLTTAREPGPSGPG
jgi:hypothetical protein